MADMAEDLAALLDSLKIKKAVIVGHSMGGYVALAFARGFTGRMLGLGLVASQALADAPEKKAARYQEAEHVLSHGVGDVAADMSTKLTDNPDLQAQLKRPDDATESTGIGWGRCMPWLSDRIPCSFYRILNFQ